MNLINSIELAIGHDDDDTDRNSQRILRAYEDTTPEAREVIDDIFVSLCGWSLSTLIMRAHQPEDPDATPETRTTPAAATNGESPAR